MTQFYFTPQDIVSMVMWICGAICTISAAAGVIAKIIEKAQKPNKSQNERLDEIERRLASYDRFFDTDKKRIDSIEESNRVTQRALLALLSHAINGDNIAELKDAETALREFLIKGRG